MADKLFLVSAEIWLFAGAVLVAMMGLSRARLVRSDLTQTPGQGRVGFVGRGSGRTVNHVFDHGS